MHGTYQANMAMHYSDLVIAVGARFDAAFRDASAAREQVLGGNERTHLDDWPSSSVAASFPGLIDLGEGGMRDYVFPTGCDLTPVCDVEKE